jgi:hypothetical protein
MKADGMNAKATSMNEKSQDDSPEWTLSITPENVCDFILRLREFQAKEEGDDLADGSNPVDDGMSVILEDVPEDAVESELREFIRGLNVDEQIDLVALAWLGRGDGLREEWVTLRADAAREYNARTIVRYLLGMPMLPDYLGEALEEFGETCDK